MRPKLGCFNLHASLLPRWRGAAPINRAIMAGDAETGVMVMKMDAGLDTGDVAMAERLAISDAMTAADLHDALARLGGRPDGARDGRAGTRQAATDKQSEDGVTYAAKIEKAEARIDWNKPARAVLRHIHGLSPFPGAWCEMAIDGEPVRVKILRCELADGSGAPGERARRSSHDRLQRRRDPHSRAAARRQGADEGGGILARHAAETADAARIALSTRNQFVIRGLDPRIHLSSQESFEDDGWPGQARRMAARHRIARPMPRYKLTIEYDGSPYCGWQQLVELFFQLLGPQSSCSASTYRWPKSRRCCQRLLGRDLFWWLTRPGHGREHQNAARPAAAIPRRIRDRHQPSRSASRPASPSTGFVHADGHTVRFADGTSLEVGVVIWATGHRPDYSWIEIPGVLHEGRVAHRRGVTDVPGLYLLGLSWQRTRGSALLGFVNDDAAHLAHHIVDYQSAATRHADTSAPHRSA